MSCVQISSLNYSKYSHAFGALNTSTDIKGKQGIKVWLEQSLCFKPKQSSISNMFQRHWFPFNNSNKCLNLVKLCRLLKSFSFCFIRHQKVYCFKSIQIIGIDYKNWVTPKGELFLESFKNYHSQYLLTKNLSSFLQRPLFFVQECFIMCLQKYNTKIIKW